MLQTLERNPVSLRQLLPGAEFFGASDLLATSCTADSRACLPGDIFVARVGSRYDGHEFAKQAIARGAVGVLAERPVPINGLPVCVTPDTRVAHGMLCQALAGNPSRKLKLIGITGTNGKTTTSCLIGNILLCAGHRVGLLGTLGYCDSVETAPAPLTTPDAPVLARWLRRMVDADCSHAVMEVSSHALAQSRVAGLEFDAACITNIRRDHLDFHGSLENYRRAKLRLFEQLTPEGFVVLNADDPVSESMIGQLSRPVLTVGTGSIGEITASLVERTHSEQTFMLSAGRDSIPVRTQMIGDHHIQNCLIAAAAGLIYGVDLPTVVRGLESAGHVPGRLERIECGQPFGVFVDYAHTPDGLTAVLQTLRHVTSGKLICVFGAGGERDRKKRPLMGRAVERGADIAVVTSDNPRREDPAEIAQQVLDGFHRPGDAEMVLNRADAIHYALSMAQPGDTVLLAGKGHEEHQVLGSVAVPFDDREVARRWLYNLEPEEATDADWTMKTSNS